MGKLQIGVLLPNTGHVAGPAAIREVAEAAEQLGIAGLWVGDHIALSAKQDSDYPYKQGSVKSYEVPYDRPYLEAFTTLGFAAAVTRECYLGIGVGILPYRHPLLWAKLIGSVQNLSGGRLNFGVGVGWLKEEFDALGVDYHARGAIADETLECLRSLPGGAEAANFKGNHFSFENMAVNPTFSSPKQPLVWIGGNGNVAMRRVARYGDIWHPHIHGSSPVSLKENLAKVREMAEKNGRSIVGAGLHAPVDLTEKATSEPWNESEISGPPQFLADTLHQYADAGVGHVVLAFGGGPKTRIDRMEKIMNAVGDLATR